MIVDLAIPVRVNGSFHYRVDSEIRSQLTLGSIVQVTFRNKPTHGFVLGFPETTDIEDKKLKDVQSILSAAPLFDEAFLKFLRWVSEYYCHPLGEVMASAMPRQAWFVKPKSRAKNPSASMMVGAAWATAKDVVLTEEQRFAIERITDPEEKRPILLHGVTGSGKTEVYMSALEKILAQGKGAIILVPEIALTPQLLGRFSSRFPDLVAVLHSELTPREKFNQWQRIRTGEARIVIGARSAVFAPVSSLGLIVVDEEHEASFKQEDSFRYHARDVAVVRGHFAGAKVVLGSATPSLESFANAQNNKYLYVAMRYRANQRALPKTYFVNVKEQRALVSPETPWLSHFLFEKIQETLARKQQSLLYLNRLGFAHFLFCDDCSHTWRCKNCDVALTYYQNPPMLKCHYCGVILSAPSICEVCSGTHLKTLGVGTEQAAKKLQELLPQARIARMDRSVIKNRKDLEQILAKIAAQEVDIIIGTQMIAKGHDFPSISLVGILLADSSLNMPDFRANEKTYQILTQVSGRAGRAEIAGEVVIQTINPEHPIIRAAAENRAGDFYRMELDTRKAFGFPPFRRLSLLRFQHKDQARVRAFAEELVRFLGRYQKSEGIVCDLLGPAEAPLSRINNVYRWQCLVKADSITSLQRLLFAAQEFANQRKSPVQFAVDVDPVNAL